MKRRDGILNVVSIALALALVIGLCGALLGAGRLEPQNPIGSRPDPLYADSLEGSGNLYGDNAGTENGTEPERPEEPPTEPTEEMNPPTEPAEETSPSETPPPEETEPEDILPEEEQPEEIQPEAPEDSENDSDVPPTTPVDDTGGNQGGETAGDSSGGANDSNDPGDGTGGGDGDGGGTGGDGTGGEEDNTPRIYTDLSTRSVTRADLPDGKLTFFAYPVGEGDNLYIRVRLKNGTNTGNGRLLTSADGENYEATLDFNAENTFFLSLYDGERFLGSVQYRISYYEDLADEKDPQKGSYPPSIITNLDGESLDMTSQTFPLTVIARTHAELGAKPIYSNHITVTLDGKTVAKSYGDSQPTYELYFDAPQSGDEEKHVIRILAWDGNGNSAMKVYTVTYHQIGEGDPAGSVSVVLDATTVGLGILDSGSVPIVEGETAASVVLRFLEEYGYEADYQGNTTTNFYLRRIYRGDIAYRASVPERLWEMIQRDGIPTNGRSDRDSLGEFDYTMGSGWMYSINGQLYEGTGMSGYKARDGITIYLRFTLSYGKDIGGYEASGGGYGSLSSYCGIWVNGGYRALDHDFVETERVEATATEAGYIRYTCSKCHELKDEVLPATGEETPPTDPDPTDPDPTEPDPTEPDPTEPDPAEPDSTEPDPTEPDPAEPDPTDPGGSEPGAGSGDA